MRVVWTLAAGFTALILAANSVVYLYRARVLRQLPACDTEPRLGLLDAAWAFVKECAASAAVLVLVPVGWCVPTCRTAAGARGPVILVHGWSLNRGSLWLLRRRLLRDGWSPVCCFDYASVRADIEPAAARLRQLVEDLARSAPQHPVILVGHDLGGLVLRYYARRYPAPAVRRIVTLGTPHAGTQLAAFLPAMAMKLSPRATLITTLNAADRVPQQFDVVAVHSTFDALILPPASAEYPAAFNIRVTDIGHYMLLFSGKIYTLLAENLAAPLR